MKIMVYLNRTDNFLSNDIKMTQNRWETGKKLVGPRGASPLAQNARELTSRPQKRIFPKPYFPLFFLPLLYPQINIRTPL